MAEQTMTEKQVALAKEKVTLLDKFGMTNSSVKLQQRIDISYDVKKIEAKGYSIVNLEDGSLNARLCPPQVVGKKTVVVKQEKTGFFGNKVKDITEEQDDERTPVLNNSDLTNWGGDIPLSVLQKINKAKKDGFKNFQVYYPQIGGQYNFSCNDPVVVGYISQTKYKNCHDYGGSSIQCAPDSKLCKKEHWQYFPIGPAFEIAAWEQCDIDKERL